MAEEMTERGPDELVREVIRQELKAAETMDTLLSEHEPDVVEEAIVDVVDEFTSRVETRGRAARILLYAHKLAQEIQSDDLAKETLGAYQELVEGEG